MESPNVFTLQDIIQASAHWFLNGALVSSWSRVLKDDVDEPRIGTHPSPSPDFSPFIDVHTSGEALVYRLDLFQKVELQADGRVNAKGRYLSGIPGVPHQGEAHMILHFHVVAPCTPDIVREAQAKYQQISTEDGS